MSISTNCTTVRMVEAIGIALIMTSSKEMRLHTCVGYEVTDEFGT